MNERIKELAIEAGGGPSKWYTDPDVLEHFAELIVRECITKIESDQWAQDNQSWSKGMLYAAGIIKEHFGVEE